jgi:hypothetical protein
MLLTLTAALSVVLPAGAGMAISYSGNYPLTVTDSMRNNGTDCLTLTDNGSAGAKHSGQAEMSGTQFYGKQDGTFQVIGQFVIVTIDVEGYDSLVFFAPAGRGTIGTGDLDEVYLDSLDAGKVAFGTKDGC